jgi:hypothetical protein
MYVPYRKAYISGMNPLSFVTVFTIGELVTCFALVLALDGGTKAAIFHSPETKHLIFWLFLGGFVWVIGDLFQQFATKYLGIGRAIPLSNTNQLWGLAWGALVFGELAHADWSHRLLVVAGSLVMIVGALAVSTAVATERENFSINQALLRECSRYGLNYDRVMECYHGSAVNAADEPASDAYKTSRAANENRRSWWDYSIVAAAVGVFIYLGLNARVPSLGMNFAWLSVLVVFLLAAALVSGWGLWKATRFS